MADDTVERIPAVCHEAARHSPMRPYVALSGALFAIPGVVLLVLGRGRR